MSSRYLSRRKPIVASPAPSIPRTERRCHPSYSGACVPIASDVDCAGGSGNGPAYVRGPFRVVGPDVYRLDRDRDGIACE
nr:excalibur calcium-binding domain-containing protein [Rhodovulum sulfidophilum]